jgi:DNA-binding CsgD family transcriptional regulator
MLGRMEERISPPRSSQGTGEPQTVPAWLPGWARRIGAAVWVCDADQRLAYVNERASRLLKQGCDSAGRPSCEAVGGRCTKGQEQCRPGCEIRRRLEQGHEVQPMLWRRVRARDGWLMVVPVPLAAPDGRGTWILHIAEPLDELERSRSYVERLAFRSEQRSPEEARAALARLSRREQEILGLLCADQDPAAIARNLFLSPVTVRNHVQHVLAKLEVHSIQESVALHLLHADAGERPSGRAGERALAGKQELSR